jgi:two-component system, cell cycle response regulator
MSVKHITRILIVDGSSVTRELLTRTLAEKIKQAEIVTCDNGEHALQMANEQKFDLITTSLMLSDMDGLKLCSTLRETKNYHYTPVIVVSGDANDRLLREGFEAGVTDYFDKSSGYKAFADFIASFIQRNAGWTGKVLFVEDSMTAAKFTIKILEKQGLEVIHTVSAEEALKKLQVEYDKNEEVVSFDLVITDFHLVGDMTGGDLVHAIRARFHYTEQQLPVLVLTGSDERQTQVGVFRAGANDFVMKPIVEEVLLARVRALLLIKHQHDALTRQTEAMRWIASTDSLTGVRSKRYLVDNGENYIAENVRQPVNGVLIDIDHFKKINDTLGHIRGDSVLAEMGDTINVTFPDCMSVRFGGEEFCLLIPNTDTGDALKRVDDFRKDIEKLKPGNVDVTISIGLVSTNEFADKNLSDFLALADKALYAAKENGRNRTYLNTSDGILPYVSE